MIESYEQERERQRDAAASRVEERAAGWQQLGGDQVRGAPDQRGERRERDRPVHADPHLNVELFNVKITDVEPERDAVDKILEQWRVERPDLS